MMKNIKKISQKFRKNNKTLYIVGGFCRDQILGISNSNTDIDFTTDALPEETNKIVNCVAHVWKKYGTQIIHEDNQNFEITTFRKDIWILNNRKPVSVKFTNDINLDALRRDFTFNAVYLNPITQEYIDPLWGIKDLKNNIIRFIWEPKDRIHEDALRILRFIRFKNTYNFSPAEADYFEIIKKDIWLLKNISKERVKKELDKILLLSNNTQALKDLKEIWFFHIYLTELDKQSETPGNKYHQESNVWIHTLMTIEYLNIILPKNTDQCLNLLWTMLLHDIAKPICYTKDIDWNGHYYWHEHSGVEIFQNQICKELPFSNKSRFFISWIIGNHLKIYKIFEVNTLQSRTLMMHKLWPSLLIIWEADHMGRIPASQDVIEKIQIFYSHFLQILKTKTFLTWKDVLEKFPELQWSEIWQKLQELNNQILTKDDENIDL